MEKAHYTSCYILVFFNTPYFLFAKTKDLYKNLEQFSVISICSFEKNIAEFWKKNCKENGVSDASLDAALS